MVILAVLAFCGAFGVAWHCTGLHYEARPSREATPVGEAERSRATLPVAIGSPGRGPRGALGTLPTRRDPEEHGAIRRSDLPEWGRFRHEHPDAAVAAEMAAREALNRPVPLRDVADACRANGGGSAVSQELALSAAIVIAGRDVTVSGIGCDTEGGADGDAAARFCDCLLATLQDEFRARIPAEVADKDLAAYDGMMSLKLWQL